MAPEIAVERNDEGQAVICISPTEPMTVLEAEAYMCNLMEAITMARDLDGDPLPA